MPNTTRTRGAVKAALMALALAALTAPAAGLRALAVQDLTTGNTPDALAARLMGPGVSLVAGSLDGAWVNRSLGSFSGGTAALGMESGVVLSTGNANSTTWANNLSYFVGDGGAGGDGTNGLGGCAALGADTLDATWIQFTFIPSGEDLYFNYVFSSDEYNKYVDMEYNDTFGMLINGVNVAYIPGTTTLVAINSVNDHSHSSYFVSNLDCHLPFSMNGRTVVLAIHAKVTPGVPNTALLAVADRRDTIIDTNVFIQDQSFFAPTETATPTFSASPSPTETASPTISPTATRSLTHTISPTFTASPTFSATPTISLTHTITPTFSASPSFSHSPTATPTATITDTFTHSPTASATATITPTLTASPTASATPTITPTATATASMTAGPTRTVSPSPQTAEQPLILHRYGNNPNPFGPDGTYITYWLSVDATVTIQVWTLSGEWVRDLKPFDGKAGNNETFWNGRNHAEAAVSSGVFVYRIKAVSRRGETAYDFGKCAAVR